ncbi:hypothetical protein MHYP_G00103300 [Metynnis hypsauchen]
MGSRLCNQLFHASYVSGAFGTEWSVKYNQQEICALKGSTVFMNGTFTHPEGRTVTETFWTLDQRQKPDLSKDPVYSGRVEFFTDEQKHFSLKLRDVMKKDERQFYFRIITNKETEKWVGVPGVKLRVTDVVELHVEAPEEVTEGETADLTCNTTYSLTDPTFIWYKDGGLLPTKTIKNNQLHLQTVSSEDAGSYSCAVRGSQHLCSTAHSLRVRYPPKSVSVSIRPSGEIVEGSSVTLTCSSDGNPPVKIYTWFIEGGTSPVGSGQNYSIISITADHTGLYYCEAQNDHGALNGTVMVSVKSSPVILFVAVGLGLCFIAVFLTVVLWRRLFSESWRKRHGGNMDQQIYVNVGETGLSTPPRSEDESSSPVYANVTNVNQTDCRPPPPSDDASGHPVYGNVDSIHTVIVWRQ